MVMIFAFTTSTAFTADELPLHTAKIMTKYKIKLKKVGNAGKKLINLARKTAVIRLKKEMEALTRAADLDKAIAARDLMRLVKKSSDIPDISEDDKKYTKNSVNIIKQYTKRLSQVDDYLQKNKTKIQEDLITDLKKEMIKMDEDGFIADSLTIKDMLKKIEDPEFSLLDFKFTIQKEASKKESPKKRTKQVVLKPKINPDELIRKTSLALGSNILADNIASERGLIYICFSENLKPNDKTTLAIREKIENNLFVLILPCSMSEDDFKIVLEQRVRDLLKEDKRNNALLKYCVMLLHLNPKLKNDKEIVAFIKKPGQPNSVSNILKFNKKTFGGTREAEDLRIQIDKTDITLIDKLLGQAKQLTSLYPKNKNVKKLLNDLLRIKAATPKPQPAASKPVKAEYKDCDECEGTGWKDQECPVCKGKKGEMCARCIGSGVIVSTEDCKDCKGKGKTWLGTACKTCNGKGKIRKKEPCPECTGTGTKQCSKCKGKGTLREQCKKCQGKGKVEIGKQ